MINQVSNRGHPNPFSARRHAALLGKGLQLDQHRGCLAVPPRSTAAVSTISFQARADLLAAVLDMYHEGIRPMLLEPAWAGVSDPIDRIFALLARYRKSLLDTDCFYGCPIGSLALELHEPDLAVRERLAENFSAWIDAIAECLSQAKARLPSELDLQELAQFVLTVMEGGVMQARTFRDIEYFDAAVRQLRQYFKCLERAGGLAARKPAGPDVKSKKHGRKIMRKLFCLFLFVSGFALAQPDTAYQPLDISRRSLLERRVPGRRHRRALLYVDLRRQISARSSHRACGRQARCAG